MPSRMDRSEILTKEMLVHTASVMYALVKDHIHADEETLLNHIHERFKARSLQFGLPNPVYFKTSEGQLSLVGLPRWAHFGYPTITMGHRYAAALLSTTATAEAISLAQPPFASFILELPDQLLFTDDPEKPGERLTLRRVLVQRVQDRWGFIAYSDYPVSLYRHGQTSEELSPPTGLDDDTYGDRLDPFQYEVTDRDGRVIYLIGRLIINICLAMSDPTAVRAIGKSHARWEKYQGSKRASDEPIVRVFQVGKPIQHDFRDAVREFVEGQRRKLSVQVLVRGHFKTQHYGPKNSKIKVIWREPFWRGPEDAPIPIRPHNLGTPTPPNGDEDANIETTPNEQ